jgi:hypothetical protein
MGRNAKVRTVKPEYWKTPEERTKEAIQQERRALQAAQKDDPLVKRMKTVAFWRRCLVTNKGYSEPQCRALYHNVGFWPYLMPKLQAMLKERKKAQEQAQREIRRKDSMEWEAKKAALLALKKSAKTGQGDMFV